MRKLPVRRQTARSIHFVPAVVAYRRNLTTAVRPLLFVVVLVDLIQLEFDPSKQVYRLTVRLVRLVIQYLVPFVPAAQLTLPVD